MFVTSSQFQVVESIASLYHVSIADMSGEEEPDAAHLCNDGCSHQSQNISWRNKSQLFEKLIRVPVTSQSRGLCLEKTTLDDK